MRDRDTMIQHLSELLCLKQTIQVVTDIGPTKTKKAGCSELLLYFGENVKHVGQVTSSWKLESIEETYQDSI